MSSFIPDFLETMLVNQYGRQEAAQIMAGYGKRRPVTLRINTLKSGMERVQACLSGADISWSSVPWYRDALILNDVREDAVRALPIYENGEIYLQSLSSMLPPLLVEPSKGESILDMAAAPGGKTTQLAALSKGQAQITACEKNAVRAERLKYNLNRQGAGNVLVMREDARKLDPFFSFDKILLDAPCSGSGTLYFGDEAARGKQTFTKELIERSARTQEALLKKALELLKPGHEMVYSTCSVLEQENEQILKRLLSPMKAEIIPIVHPMTESLPLLPTKLEGTLCVCPTELYEGFFVARLRKKGGKGAAASWKSGNTSR